MAYMDILLCTKRRPIFSGKKINSESRRCLERMFGCNTSLVIGIATNLMCSCSRTLPSTDNYTNLFRTETTVLWKKSLLTSVERLVEKKFERFFCFACNKHEIWVIKLSNLLFIFKSKLKIWKGLIQLHQTLSHSSFNKFSLTRKIRSLAKIRDLGTKNYCSKNDNMQVSEIIYKAIVFSLF